MRSLRKLALLLAHPRNTGRRRLRRKRRKRFGATRNVGASLAGWSKLPLDLREAVLAQLPFAQVFQFRLVCKEWHRILSDPAFLKGSLAFQKICSSCVIVPECARRNSIGSSFNTSSGSWRAMPSTPAELGDLNIMASDRGLLVGRSILHGSLCVYNPLLQLFRLLPACGEHVHGGRTFVHLVVGADTRSFKVFNFSFHGKGWEEPPPVRQVDPRLSHDPRGIEVVPLALKNGFCTVHVFDSTSDSWSKLPHKPPLNFSRTDAGLNSLRGPYAVGSGSLFFEARQYPWHRLTSLVAFVTKQGVWKEHPLPSTEGLEGAGFGVEHLLHSGNELLFLRIRAPGLNLPVFLQVYRFNELTDSWVMVRLTATHFAVPEDFDSPLLRAMLIGDRMVCQDKVVFWFKADLGEAMAFSLEDGKWRLYPVSAKHCREQQLTTFSVVPSFIPSLIQLAGMACATPPFKQE